MSSFKSAFSEINIPPATVGKLFLVANHTHIDQTLEIAMSKPVTEATAVVFISGMFSLSYASARGLKSPSDRRIQHLLCLDHSKAVQEFWLLVSPVICDSTDAADCGRKIHELVNKEASKFFPPIHLDGLNVAPSEEAAEQWLKLLDSEISRGSSWLSNDERFQIIKSIFMNNNFVHIPVDLHSVSDVKLISQALDSLALKIDTIYLSNVAELIKPEDFVNYQQAIQTFQANSTPDTFLIDTHPRNATPRLRSSKPPRQRIRQSFQSEAIENLITPAGVLQIHAESK